MLECSADLDKKIFKLGELNELASDILILMFNTNPIDVEKEFHSSKIGSVEEDLDEWNIYLEGLQFQDSKFWIIGNIIDEDFMIHVECAKVKNTFCSR